MKKVLALCIFLALFISSFLYHEEISNFIIEKYLKPEETPSELINNEYAMENNYKFIQLTDNFYPKNQEDIKNIYFTVINSGMDEFTFYCDKEYTNCIDDVNYISNNQKILSYLNNFVHVYNSFKNIETEFNSHGKITIKITHSYNKNEIEEINNKIDSIIKEIIKPNMTVEDKVKAIHDYIINHTKYDVEKSDNKVNTYHSDIAYGPLIEGYAICGGYADSIKLLLDYFNIPNFKISSENHIWNAIYINNKWLHLDATWDDPVTSTGEDILDYSYFLITTEELKELEIEQHGFDKEIYQELKNN